MSKVKNLSDEQLNKLLSLGLWLEIVNCGYIKWLVLKDKNYIERFA